MNYPGRGFPELGFPELGFPGLGIPGLGFPLGVLYSHLKTRAARAIAAAAQTASVRMFAAGKTAPC
jgi:hypothetical protein